MLERESLRSSADLLLECASVRLSVILLLLAVVPLSQADTIVLKNGKRIIVDTAREKNGRLEYEIGDNSYAIPMTLVERVEAVGAPVSPSAAIAPPDFIPSETLSIPTDLYARLVHDGKLDADVLAESEHPSDPQTAAAAYFVAARYEQDHGNRDRALSYYQRAIGLLPNSTTVIDHYASLLIQMGRGAEAVPLAERSTRMVPKSSDGWTVLGYAYYASDRNSDAIHAWQTSLNIRPDATVRRYLEKAQRDASTEAAYSQRESGHFTLRYEGRKISESMINSVLSTLEAHYANLSTEFGTEPRGNIAVVLYTDQAFFDVTQTPSWTGAVNDGKIRLPVSGVTSMTPELSRILRHELAHSFITQISRGRCPQWLHEGVAQLVEPRTAAPYGRTLARLFAEQHQVPMNLLEGSFLSLGGQEAAMAYAQSLAVAEYINQTFGMAYIRLILERIGEGASTESALRTVIHSGYDKLEIEVGNYLKDRYGM